MIGFSIVAFPVHLAHSARRVSALFKLCVDLVSSPRVGLRAQESPAVITGTPLQGYLHTLILEDCFLLLSIQPVFV